MMHDGSCVRARACVIMKGEKCVIEGWVEVEERRALIVASGKRPAQCRCPGRQGQITSPSSVEWSSDDDDVGGVI